MGLMLLAEAQVDTVEVYRNSRHVPIWQSRNVEKLSDALAKPCSNDEELVLVYAYQSRKFCVRKKH